MTIQYRAMEWNTKVMTSPTPWHRIIISTSCWPHVSGLSSIPLQMPTVKLPNLPLSSHPLFSEAIKIKSSYMGGGETVPVSWCWLAQTLLLGWLFHLDPFPRTSADPCRIHGIPRRSRFCSKTVSGTFPFLSTCLETTTLDLSMQRLPLPGWHQVLPAWQLLESPNIVFCNHTQKVEASKEGQMVSPFHCKIVSKL